jgi:hypothetical protein
MDIGKVGIWFLLDAISAPESAQIGPEPWICAAQAVILERDATKARTMMARQYMKPYVPRLPNYTNNLKAPGYGDAEFENGCSDRLVDAIVAWGSEDKIRDRINAHLKAGATHVCILPIRSDNESLPDLRAIQAFAPR